MKPFRPPLLINRPKPETPRSTFNDEPPAKKRRISPELEDGHVEAVIAAANILKQPKPREQFRPPQRKPLVPVQNPTESSTQEHQSNKTGETHYIVLWRKFTAKKNKTWDGDGVLSIRDCAATLKDISGKDMGRGVCKVPLSVGSELSISGKDIEVESVISREDYLAGRPFLGNVKTVATISKDKLEQRIKVTHKSQSKPDSIVDNRKDRLVPQVVTSKAGKAAFKTPLLENTVQVPRKDVKIPVPRHDPTAAGALVMKRPRSAPKGKQIVDVVVDPLLTKHLREHQRIGVQFMYECVMGMKDYNGEGAILADEMGLGKTLQTIALLWTLLKQNPTYEEAPVIKKALVVCPVTLIHNWRREFNRWLGKERIGVFVAGNKDLRLTDFTKGRSYNVMIIGYEKLRTVQTELQKCSGIDIVIADEGHRLKTAQNKAALAIKSLSTERRIILSGTPLQNDLTEFFTMVDFVNPGLLGKYNTFKREFEVPIIKGRQPGASEEDIEKGAGRSEELGNTTGKFILRRTLDILSKYLPPKTEYVVFCRPTPAQIAVYRATINSPIFNAALGSPAISLGLINVLKKICNSPTLLLKKANGNEEPSDSTIMDHIPQHLLKSPGASGKLQVLDSLLHRIRTTTEEKVVLVSNYTSTMDILGNLLDSLSYKYLRLDGSTPPNKRQELVDRFNRSPANSSFVFLLSAKAGGTGLNLIGASRLVLFDLDWNPATDLQAMARIHRDGQKRPCYIYRLLTQGALDEKIFQRQVSKTGLADSIVDGKSGVSGFTREELRDLFSLNERTDGCQTHTLLGCECRNDGMPMPIAEHEPEPHMPLSTVDVPESDTEVDADEAEEAEEAEKEVFISKAHFTKLSEVDIDAQEEELVRKAKDSKQSGGRAKMLSLMQYMHFDPSRYVLEHETPTTKASVSADEKEDLDEDENENENEESEISVLDTAIEDAVLRSVLRDETRRVGFVFAKLSSGRS